MGKLVLSTERLQLHEFSPDDAAEMYRLNNDPEVMRYTGDPPFESVAAARLFLERYDQYARYGFGRWAVVLQSNGQFLGWCGLRYSDELRGVDLGFRLHRHSWGQGYATEAARACVEYGFAQLDLKTIWGRAMLANVASIRVLEKVGFTFVKQVEFALHEGVLYKVDKGGSAYPSSSSLSHS